MRGIFIYDDRNKSEPRVLFAKEGEIFTREGLNINLLLKDGYINIAKGDMTTELAFKKYNMLLKLESDSPGKKDAELTPFELYEKLKSADRRRASNLYPELYRRISLPLLCIILIFFGPPLSMIAGKSGRLGGLTLGLAVFMVYYMILLYFENLVRADRLPPSIGAWVPTMIHRCCCSIAVQERKFAMKLMRRYYIKEFAKLLGIIAFGLALIFSLLDLIDKIDDFVPGKMSILDFIHYAALNLPKYLYYLLPMSLLICSLFVFSQASRYKEIVALRQRGAD